MKASQIQIGNRYTIQLGKNTTAVKAASFDKAKSTWLCETESGKILRVSNTDRFLKEIKPKHRECKAGKKGPRKHVTMIADRLKETGRQPSAATRGPKPNGKMSVLAAAHLVLQEEGRPMKVHEIMETALARKYCLVSGKTPFNTFNGGIRMEITKKGNDARFVWVDKGMFAAR